MKRPIYGRFQRFEIIPALCRHLYLVVGLFRKAQYLVDIFHLFHHFYDHLIAESGFLVAKTSDSTTKMFRPQASCFSKKDKGTAFVSHTPLTD